MIHVSNLSFHYEQTPLFEQLNLTIEKGSLTAIFGPNGVGKTTFLKLLSGLMKPSSGSITVDTKSIGFLVQRNRLDVHFPFTVYQLAEMGAFGEDTACIEYALKTVALWDIRHKYLDEISGGQFQRALFARLIVQNSHLILLDEPFNAVDCQTLHYLIHQIQLWHEEGKTILVVLHDFELIKKYFQKCIFIGSHFIESLNVHEINYEKMTQMIFCGKHYGAHDVF